MYEGGGPRAETSATLGLQDVGTGALFGFSGVGIGKGTFFVGVFGLGLGAGVGAGFMDIMLGLSGVVAFFEGVGRGTLNFGGDPKLSFSWGFYIVLELEIQAKSETLK